MKKWNYLVIIGLLLSIFTSILPFSSVQADTPTLKREMEKEKQDSERMETLYSKYKEKIELRRQVAGKEEMSAQVIQAIPEYTIRVIPEEGTGTSFTKGDFATIELEFVQSAIDISDIWLNLEVEKEGKVFRDYIYLQAAEGSDRIFESDIYFGDYYISGDYNIKNIEVITRDDNYSMIEDGFPMYLFSVYGTMGGYQPNIAFTLNQTQYTQGNKVQISMEVDRDVFEFNFAYLSIDTVDDESWYPIDVEMTWNSVTGRLEGEFTVDTYMKPEEYVVTNVYLESQEYSVQIFNSQIEWYANENYLDDFSGANFSVVGTVADYTSPVMKSVKLSGSTMKRGGQILITVEAEDEISGVESVEVSFESDTDYTSVRLYRISGNVFQGSFRVDPFSKLEPNWEMRYIFVRDRAKNESYYSKYDFNVPSISVEGYSSVGEIAGSNRYNTAVEVSQYINPSDTVIIASGVSFPDALAAGPLSYYADAPILLAQKDRISDSTLNEMKRRGATHAIILGGTGAISDAVIETIKSQGIKTVERITGTNRYYTAAAIGERFIKEYNEYYNNTNEVYTPDTVVLASGNSFPDALAAGGFAATYGYPILLTGTKELHSAAREFIAKYNVENVIVVGGEAAISGSIYSELGRLTRSVRRISGSNRYATATAIADEFFQYSDRAILASGQNFADALAAAPLSAQYYMPILLTNSTQLSSSPMNFISEVSETTSIEHVVVVGGNAAVSDAVKASVQQALLKR